MKKNGKNEELQSRREFFKRAAKGALEKTMTQQRQIQYLNVQWLIV